MTDRISQPAGDGEIPAPCPNRGAPGGLHSLFEAQVRRTPDAVAVVFGTTELSYANLNARANQLAHHLRTLGVGPEVLVGICLDRSIELIVGILGILKAGGAYVPLDPAYPEKRLEFLLEDTRVSVLVTRKSLQVRVPWGAGRILCVEGDGPLIRNQPIQDPVAGVTSNCLAYVIYTSGSTGTPKGVMIEHRSAMAFLQWTTTAFTDAELAVTLFGTSVCFDLSIFELFAPLIRGGRACLVENVLELLSEGVAAGVTLVNTVPSAMAELLRCNGIPKSVRTINLAGEPLKAALVDELYRRTAVNRVVDLYGPTETTTYSTYAVRRPGEPATIGRPIAGTQIHLLDGKMNPVPSGEAGEVYIGGAGLARGYWNRPELTAERFVADPFAVMAGARLYRTGDLARSGPAGDLEYLGRLDQQVKIRGFRIELGEIEVALARHSGVWEALVLAREAVTGGQHLVAYFVPRDVLNPPSLQELRGHLQQWLPEYMVPAAWMALSAWPLTLNGKVDRKALPSPDLERGEKAETGSAPRTAVEELLAAIWSEVLGAEAVGLDESFLVLGGHSLMAMRVVARVRDALRVDVPVRVLFENSTIRRLAGWIETARDGATASLSPVRRRPTTERTPLSFAQERLWFLDRLEPGGAAYHIPLRVRLRGALNEVALERSLRELVRRHEVLRTRYIAPAGTPEQRVESETEWRLVRLDQWNLPAGQREAEAARWARKAIAEPFDLARDYPLRARLLRWSEQEHELVLTLHHIAADGWSLGVLWRELDALYRAYARGQASPLAELPIQYADHAVWQREWLSGERLNQQLAYWQRRLAGAPRLLDLPTDYPRRPTPERRGARETWSVDPELTQRLRVLSRQEGVTLFMTLLGAWQVLLLRQSGQEDLVVGAAVAGRSQTELEGLIGFFVNTLPLRVQLGGNPTFQAVLRQVREVTLEAYSHADLPFERLVQELQPERVAGRTPLVQVMVVLQNAPETVPALDDLAVEVLEADSGAAKFDLTLSLRETAGGVRCELEYDADLFAATSIQRLLEHWETLLRGVVADPRQTIGELPLLSARERQQLAAWNETAADYPRDVDLATLFEAVADQRAEATALRADGQGMTYGELEIRANRLANHLIARGVVAGTFVGLELSRSLDFVIAVLAILKAGAAYLPVPREYPATRRHGMLEDGQVRFIITVGGGEMGADPPELTRVDLRGEAGEIAGRSAARPKRQVAAMAPAYVMFTSGSTGRPKGVVVPHRAVVRLVRGTDFLPWGPDLRFLLLAPVAFDASTLELWGALLHGATLVVFTPEFPDAHRLGRVLQEERITCLWLTAGMFNQIVDDAPDILRSVRHLLTGGEALSPVHVRRARELLPETRLVNGYGPTESTTFACTYAVPTVVSGEDSIPIGRPIANTRCRVRDAQGQPVPVGVAGELWIGGDGLALGYVGDAELTAAKFVPEGIGGAEGERWYRTGDRVRYRVDGNLEFLGRMDQQVKIRGFRIEPGEIEAALARHPEVREAVVLAREDTPGEKRLVAYVVAAQAERPPTLLDARGFLRDFLPDYMLPTALVVVAHLPLSTNGKLDSQALPAPSAGVTTTVGPAAALDLLEWKLIQIWEQLFQRPGIGRDDNFFELGGHSLLAARLAVQVETLVQRRVPIAALFHAPTIAGLAEMLRREDWAPAWSSLVPLHPEGRKTSLFFIHGWGGDVYWFLDLARELKADRPIFGVQAVGLDGRQARHETMEAMAAHYAREIRAFQPAGPYLLAGHSLGGWIAYAVAQELIRQGGQVAWLGLIDTHANVHLAWPLRARVFVPFIWERLKVHARTASANSWRTWGRFLVGRWRAVQFHLNEGRPLPPIKADKADKADKAGAASAAAAEPPMDHFQRVASRYRPARYPGDVHLLVAEDTPEHRISFWPWLVRGKVRCEPVAGTHFTMLDPEHRGSLLQAVRSALDATGS